MDLMTALDSSLLNWRLFALRDGCGAATLQPSYTSGRWCCYRLGNGHLRSLSPCQALKLESHGVWQATSRVVAGLSIGRMVWMSDSIGVHAWTMKSTEGWQRRTPARHVLIRS